MKTTTGLSFLLLIAVLCNVMFASAQGSNNSESTTVAGAYAASELLQKRWQISVVSLTDPKNFLKGSPASEKNLQWKMFLALQLVKHPELDQRQQQVIVDALSLSTSSEQVKALRSIAHDQGTELFGNIGGGKTEADILKMYYDISALPLKKRRSVFGNASPNDKRDLWKTHLALFLVKRPNLNEWQKTILLSAIALCTSEYFEIRSGDPLWKTKVRDPARALEAQIVNAFSLEDGAKIFATLGDDADLAKSSASVFLHRTSYKPLRDAGPYKQWTISHFADQEMALEGGSCQCSTESDWCNMSSSCSGSNCSPTQSGCGTLWSYPCNGASCR